MHIGKIDKDTAAARVYKALKDNAGRPVSGWKLAMLAKTSCPSTRVAEVRRQLPDSEQITTTMTTDNGRRRYYYTLVVA